MPRLLDPGRALGLASGTASLRFALRVLPSGSPEPSASTVQVCGAPLPERLISLEIT
jgi:hypothetical protein